MYVGRIAPNLKNLKNTRAPDGANNRAPDGANKGKKFFSNNCFFSSVRSSSVHHGLIEIQQQQATFSNFSNLEQSCLYTLIIHFHFHSVFNIKNRTRQYFCMNYIENSCMKTRHPPLHRYVATILY